MQMQPTSKAISCGEHTQCECARVYHWGARGPTYVRFRVSPSLPYTLPTHTNTLLFLRKGEEWGGGNRGSFLSPTPFTHSAAVRMVLMAAIYTRCAGD